MTVLQKPHQSLPIPKKILILDSHSQVRTALSARLSNFVNLQIIDQIDSVIVAKKLIYENKPDILLVETKSDPQITVNDLRHLQMTAQPHPMQIIIYTSHLDKLERETAYAAGFRHYLLKEINTKKLVEKILAL